MRGAPHTTWFSLAYGLWLLGIFGYFVPAATWNPVSRFDLTRAIVEERTLSIDAYADNTGDRALANGHWYTEKAPVPSLLAVPAYSLFLATQKLRGQRLEYSVLSTVDVPARRVLVNGPFQRGLYVCSMSTAGLGTAVLGVLLFRLLLVRFAPGAALFGSAVTILGTPLFPYATSFYGHGIAAAFLVGALWSLFSDPQTEPSRARVRFAGACLSLAAGCEYLAAVPAFVLGAFFLATARRDVLRAHLVDLALGSLGPAVLLAGYHTACFGGPLRTGYAFVVRPEFVRGHASGLMGLHLPTLSGVFGLLVGTRRGLFFLAPVTVPAVVFDIRQAKRVADPATRAGILAFAALFFVNAGYYMWWGGAAAGPRHLVPVLAFLSIGMAVAWESPRRWTWTALALLSIFNFLVITAVGLEAPDHGNVLFDYAYRRLARGQIASLSGASNIGVRLGLSPGATLGPLLVWLVLGARFLARHVRSTAPEEREPEPEVQSEPRLEP
jgi:hypothetical protein